jgi:hypothetical protein
MGIGDGCIYIIKVYYMSYYVDYTYNYVAGEKYGRGKSPPQKWPFGGGVLTKLFKINLSPPHRPPTEQSIISDNG